MPLTDGQAAYRTVVPPTDGQAAYRTVVPPTDGQAAYRTAMLSRGSPTVAVTPSRATRGHETLTSLTNRH
ncbi:hypothetical protein [Sinomonas sp. P47F7]|uniref:hypothetical protein n=1 Tax=Sinomonas sp. P47F7 TaxID=3410987 RepID=UPI003BF50957